MSDIITENTFEGALYIDTERGVISFLDSNGNRLLRVTHLAIPVPPGVMIDIVAISNLTSYTPITPQEEGKPWNAAAGPFPDREPYGIRLPGITSGTHNPPPSEGTHQYAAHPVSECSIEFCGREDSGRPHRAQRHLPPGPDDYDSEPLCEVCNRIHQSGDFVKWGPYTFIQAHEYIVWTRNSMQTYAHRGRMQFLGGGASSFRYQLSFNARGPDRSTGGRFAGTQTIDARNIVKVEEVERIPVERYVDEIDRSMKRDDR